MALVRQRLLVAGAALFASLSLWTALPLLSNAAPPRDRLADIHRKLRSAQDRLGRRNVQARVLTSDIDAFNRRIDDLHGRIQTISGRVDQLDRQVRTEQDELERIQVELRLQRARAARLKARLALARRVLAEQLVEIYKADEPDIVTVVLSSKGFADLLESASFAKRVNDELRRIMVAVTDAREQARAAAAKLAVAQRRQASVAGRAQRHRDEVATARAQLLTAQRSYSASRSRKRDALRSVRASQAEIAGEVKALQAAEGRIQAQLRSAQAENAPSFSGTSLPSSSSAAMIWPVSGPITSPFCERRSYEACHPGIDIGVPEGTPIRAAADGRVILMQSVAQSGGYGNYTCIQHTQTISSCYAHQSRFGTSLGASVRQGQVIGYVGNTGHSFGAHLHWEVRVNGAVVNPTNYV